MSDAHGHYDVTAVIAEELAAEEHAQGRPYTADPEHCDRCAEVDQAWAAAVRHGEAEALRPPPIDNDWLELEQLYEADSGMGLWGWIGMCILTAAWLAVLMLGIVGRLG